MEYTKTHERNKRITIQTATVTKSASGQPTKTWSTLTTVWAKVRTMSGNEKVKNNQVVGIDSVEICIMYSSDVSGVTVDDRVSFGGSYYDIKDVRNIDEQNIEIRMLCTQAV